MERFFRFNRLVMLGGKILVGAIMTAATFLLFINVVLRYAFASGIVWAEEMTRYTLLWTVFVGAGGAGSVSVHNEDVGECCNVSVTFTGGIAGITNLNEGSSATRNNVPPGNYTAHVSYFGGECQFDVSFTVVSGQNKMLNVSADDCSQD